MREKKSERQERTRAETRNRWADQFCTASGFSHGVGVWIQRGKICLKMRLLKIPASWTTNAHVGKRLPTESTFSPVSHYFKACLVAPIGYDAATVISMYAQRIKIVINYQFLDYMSSNQLKPAFRYCNWPCWHLQYTFAVVCNLRCRINRYNQSEEISLMGLEHDETRL